MLPVGDVLGQPPARLRDNVDLLSASEMTYPHPLTVSRRRRAGYSAGCPPQPSQNLRSSAQFAWLTEDMLKASTRSGGMAARLK